MYNMFVVYYFIRLQKRKYVSLRRALPSVLVPGGNSLFRWTYFLLPIIKAAILDIAQIWYGTAPNPRHYATRGLFSRFVHTAYLKGTERAIKVGN
jgi:hypothetical protein